MTSAATDAAPRTICPQWCAHHVQPQCGEDSYRHYGPETEISLTDSPELPLRIYQYKFVPQDGGPCSPGIELLQVSPGHRTGFAVTAEEAHRFAAVLEDFATTALPSVEILLAEFPLFPVTIRHRHIDEPTLDGSDYLIEIDQGSGDLLVLTTTESRRLARILARHATTL
ncbi:DUF6907 domain-containing protein [Nocardia takedensis]|uniref:DUF6907 domain-containing protein n=1 Tax=Nocardia takedensis TaxID=259390 RepID=UPI003F7629BF